MAGEENSWVGGGEDLLSRPREAMSSTKEGNAVIARIRGGERGGRGEVPWATLEGEGGSDGILAFKRMGVVRYRSPFGAVDWVGATGR